MTGQKSLLLIAYYFPPDTSVASNRTGYLAQYLELTGWKVTVVTRPVSNRTQNAGIIEISDPGVMSWIPRQSPISRKAIGENTTPKSRNWLRRLAFELLYFPDPQKNWRHAVLKGLENNAIYDVVLSSSQPETSHLIARDLKRLGIARFWVAEFRDLWTQNHYREGRYSRYRNWIEKELEKQVLKEAEHLVTVSEPMAQQLRILHPSSNVATITNGFTHLPTNIPVETSQEHFTILYTGQLYAGRRDPTPLFESLHNMNKNGVDGSKRIRLVFRVGAEKRWLFDLAQKYDLLDQVVVKEWTDRNEVVKEQRQATVLLLLNWNHPSEVGTYTGKLFEYMGSRRPILAVGGPTGVITMLLKRTGIGYHARSSDDLYEILTEWLSKYIESGSLPYNGNDAEIQKYNWNVLAKQYAALLDNVIKIK